MMNVDQPIGTRFTLDDGRTVELRAHEWDGRVRLQVVVWPRGWGRKPTRQLVVYMTRPAFSRRATVIATDRQEGGDHNQGNTQGQLERRS